jgi:hypothetical protein
MLGDLGSIFMFNETTQNVQKRCTAMDGRIELILTENPDKKILHTVQVERNGFIEALLSGTSLQGVGYTYMGDRAYSQFLRKD